MNLSKLKALAGMIMVHEYAPEQDKNDPEREDPNVVPFEMDDQYGESTYILLAAAEIQAEVYRFFQAIEDELAKRSQYGEENANVWMPGTYKPMIKKIDAAKLAEIREKYQDAAPDIVGDLYAELIRDGYMVEEES